MKKQFLALLGLVSFAFACKGPGSGTLVTTIDGFAQGTYYHIVYMTRDSLDLQGPIDSLLRVIDNSMSVFNPDSRISRLNNNLTDTLDDYIKHCIATAARVSEMTGGLYDITVLPLTEAWGFATKEGKDDPNTDSLVQFVGYKKIRIEGDRLVKSDPRVRIDLNSIAKGYSAELIGDLIAGYGIEDYLVELGGEIITRGRNPNGMNWIVGIDKPIEGNFIPGAQTQVTIAVKDKSIATSGNYRNYRIDAHGRKIVHTVNPHTGQSVPGRLLSATVMTDACSLSDALGTAMMVVGVERAIELAQSDPRINVYLIYTGDDGTYQTYISPELGKMIVE